MLIMKIPTLKKCSIITNHFDESWLFLTQAYLVPGVWLGGLESQPMAVKVISTATDVGGISGSVFHISCLLISLISTGHIGYATPHPGSYIPSGYD